MRAQKITSRTRAAEAASRWLDTYGEDGRGYGGDKEEILRALRQLGPSPSPSDVNAAIGNNSWTQVPECDGCGKERPRAVVRVGAELNYESRTAFLCKACVLEAAALFGYIGESK